MEITNESGVNTKKMTEEVNTTSLNAIKYNMGNLQSELQYMKSLFTTDKLQKIDDTE